MDLVSSVCQSDREKKMPVDIEYQHDNPIHRIIARCDVVEIDTMSIKSECPDDISFTFFKGGN